MEHDDRLAVRPAALLVVQVLSVSDVEHPGVVRLDLRVQAPEPAR